MAEEPVTARALAEQIEQYNIQRKQVTEDIVKDVINKIKIKIYQKSLQSFDKTEKVKFRKTQSKKAKKNSV